MYESDSNSLTTDVSISPAVGSTPALKKSTKTADDNCHPHDDHGDDNCHPHDDHEDSGGDSPPATAEPKGAEMVDNKQQAEGMTAD